MFPKTVRSKIARSVHNFSYRQEGDGGRNASRFKASPSIGCGVYEKIAARFFVFACKNSCHPIPLGSSVVACEPPHFDEFEKTGISLKN